MNKEYIDLLRSRLKYFQDKKINELTRDEIKEYLALQDELLEVYPEIAKTITDVMNEIVDKIGEIITPCVDAATKYKERVLSRK